MVFRDHKEDAIPSNRAASWLSLVVCHCVAVDRGCRCCRRRPLSVAVVVGFDVVVGVAVLVVQQHATHCRDNNEVDECVCGRVNCFCVKQEVDFTCRAPTFEFEGHKKSSLKCNTQQLRWKVTLFRRVEEGEREREWKQF